MIKRTAIAFHRDLLVLFFIFLISQIKFIPNIDVTRREDPTCQVGPRDEVGIGNWELVGVLGIGPTLKEV